MPFCRFGNTIRSSSTWSPVHPLSTPISPLSVTHPSAHSKNQTGQLWSSCCACHIGISSVFFSRLGQRLRGQRTSFVLNRFQIDFCRQICTAGTKPGTDAPTLRKKWDYYFTLKRLSKICLRFVLRLICDRNFIILPNIDFPF